MISDIIINNLILLIIFLKIRDERVKAEKKLKWILEGPT